MTWAFVVKKELAFYIELTSLALLNYIIKYIVSCKQEQLPHLLYSHTQILTQLHETLGKYHSYYIMIIIYADKTNVTLTHATVEEFSLR